MKIEAAEDSLIIENEEVREHPSPPGSSRKAKDSTSAYSSSQSSPVTPNLAREESSDMDSSSTQDTPDFSHPVYRQTTESFSSMEKGEKDSFHKEGCCSCCSSISKKYAELKRNLSEFSNRQWKTFLAIFLGTLTSSLSVCLFPPFFPKLAESKGESATIYGLVIGTNCLTAFIVTPLIARRLDAIGVNFAFLIGIFCSGACCALSGFLEYFPGGIRFVSVAIVIRILHATANACVITTTIAFIACEFPSSVAFLFSLTRATMNLAQMVGPILGGALHGIGGFKMPFFVLGCAQMVFTSVCAMILPEFRGSHSKEESNAIWGVVTVPGIWVSFVTFVFSTMSNGFISITLEPYVLRSFALTPLYIGLLFGLKDGANCIASPIWGWVCDRISHAKILIVLGSILAILSFVLLGPFPGLPLPHQMSFVVLALILNGFGIGGQQVAGVISAMRDAVTAGYPDEAGTHAFIAGLWSSLSGAGRFISRTGSGILVDTIGFRNTSAIVTGLHICVFLTSVFFLMCSKKTPTKVYTDKIPADVYQSTPSEPVMGKSESASISASIPFFREDLEDSFLMCSSSATSRRNSVFRKERLRKSSLISK